MTKHRLAIIYDVSVDLPNGETIGWAYFLRARCLQRCAPEDFQVDIFPMAKVPWHELGSYSAVLNLEYSCPSRDRIPRHVPLVVSFNADSRRRRNFWRPVHDVATYTIFNCVESFLSYGRAQRSCAISNGVDASLWYSKIPIAERPHKLLWCGSSTKGKGYHDVLKPLESLAAKHGFDFDFRPIDQITPDKVKTYAQQREWYDSGSYVLCASLSDASPNFLLEAMTCGCVPVSVKVGNIQEMGEDRINCVFVERSPESFIEGLLYAREHRERLSAAAAKTMESWSYGPPGRRADFFYFLFRALISGRIPDPFNYAEIQPEQI